MARYSKELVDELPTSEYLFSTYEDIENARTRLDTRPSYIENQIECGPKTKLMLCTRWHRLPKYHFIKDLGELRTHFDLPSTFLIETE